jgi:hypothetical protein
MSCKGPFSRPVRYLQEIASPCERCYTTALTGARLAVPPKEGARQPRMWRAMDACDGLTR